MNPDKEYNGRSKIRMYRADCMELMKSGKKWDWAIVDPPYGIGETAKRSLTRAHSTPKWKNAKPVVYSGNNNWDDKVPDSKYFNDLYNCTKNQVLWGANYYPEHIKRSMGWIAWYKKSQNPNSDFSDCEFAYTSFWRASKFFDFPWVGFGAVNAKEKRIHPTQKPVKLYKWLLTNYAKEGDTILDTHGGSMSIAIACWDLGFDLDICELDKDYFDAAVKRFENHISQQVLF